MSASSAAAESSTLEASELAWSARGPVTMDSASALLQASAAVPLPTSGVVDLAGANPVDSAALAMLLAWKRRGAAEGHPLRFANVPAPIRSLAALYGVESLI